VLKVPLVSARETKSMLTSFQTLLFNCNRRHYNLEVGTPRTPTSATSLFTLEGGADDLDAPPPLAVCALDLPALADSFGLTPQGLFSLLLKDSESVEGCSIGGGGEGGGGGGGGGLTLEVPFVQDSSFTEDGGGGGEGGSGSVTPPAPQPPPLLATVREDHAEEVFVDLSTESGVSRGGGEGGGGGGGGEDDDDRTTSLLRSRVADATIADASAAAGGRGKGGGRGLHSFTFQLNLSSI